MKPMLTDAASVEKVVQAMTLQEKARMVIGGSPFHMEAMPEYGMRSLVHSLTRLMLGIPFPSHLLNCFGEFPIARASLSAIGSHEAPCVRIAFKRIAVASTGILTPVSSRNT